MSSGSSSSSWSRLGLFSRGEKKVMDLVTANIDHSCETSHHLPQVIFALKSHDREAALKEIKTIADLESKADKMHLDAVRQISSGSFFGGIREDVLQLLEQVDNIEDAAKDSSRIFSQRNIPFEAIDYLLQTDDVLSYISKLIETVEALKVAVLALEEKGSKQKVIELSAAVERREEEADEIRAKVLGNLLTNEIKADALDIIMLKEFLEIADDVADRAEDASDVLLVLVAKGYA